MAGKDQAIGGVIFIVCVVVAVIYAVTLFYPQWLSIFGVNASSVTVQFWTLAIPVFIAFIAVMAIGAWIGWTMATTPPPKTIEEIEAENKSEAEEKRE
jgi:predicted DNA-binding transcriptional regulator